MTIQVFVNRLVLKYQHEMASREVRRQGVELGAGTRFVGRPIVDRADGSSLKIGRDCVFISDPRATALGVNHPVILRTLVSGAVLELGNDVGISGGSICSAVSVTIGDGTLIGANVTICDTDFHPIRHAERRYANLPIPKLRHSVSIGANVFIGTGAIILKGVTIEDDAVVGAGSVVTGRVKSGTVVAGNPARPFASAPHDLNLR